MHSIKERDYRLRLVTATTITVGAAAVVGSCFIYDALAVQAASNVKVVTKTVTVIKTVVVKSTSTPTPTPTKSAKKAVVTSGGS